MATVYLEVYGTISYEVVTAYLNWRGDAYTTTDEYGGSYKVTTDDVDRVRRFVATMRARGHEVEMREAD